MPMPPSMLGVPWPQFAMPAPPLLQPTLMQQPMERSDADMKKMKRKQVHDCIPLPLHCPTWIAPHRLSNPVIQLLYRRLSCGCSQTVSQRNEARRRRSRRRRSWWPRRDRSRMRTANYCSRFGMLRLGSRPFRRPTPPSSKSLTRLWHVASKEGLQWPPPSSHSQASARYTMTLLPGACFPVLACYCIRVPLSVC